MSHSHIFIFLINIPVLYFHILIPHYALCSERDHQLTPDYIAYLNRYADNFNLFQHIQYVINFLFSPFLSFKAVSLFLYIDLFIIASQLCLCRISNYYLKSPPPPLLFLLQRFHCRVLEIVKPTYPDGPYVARLQRKNGSEAEEQYHAVCICSGLHNVPYKPHLPGIESFKGRASFYIFAISG